MSSQELSPKPFLMVDSNKFLRESIAEIFDIDQALTGIEGASVGEFVSALLSQPTAFYQAIEVAIIDRGFKSGYPAEHLVAHLRKMKTSVWIIETSGHEYPKSPHADVFLHKPYSDVFTFIDENQSPRQKLLALKQFSSHFAFVLAQQIGAINTLKNPGQFFYRLESYPTGLDVLLQLLGLSDVAALKKRFDALSDDDKYDFLHLAFNIIGFLETNQPAYFYGELLSRMKNQLQPAADAV